MENSNGGIALFNGDATVTTTNASGAQKARLLNQKEWCVANGRKGQDGKRGYNTYLNEAGARGGAALGSLIGGGRYNVMSLTKRKNGDLVPVLRAKKELTEKASVTAKIDAAAESAKLATLASIREKAATMTIEQLRAALAV